MFSSLLCMCFVFFKQKTAYEMRISDWRSDVCSSDLARAALPSGHLGLHFFGDVGRHFFVMRELHRVARATLAEAAQLVHITEHVRQRHDRLDDLGEHVRLRSEEHTSELQSLMRISYAVFCLKKKNKKNMR